MEGIELANSSSKIQVAELTEVQLPFLKHNSLFCVYREESMPGEGGGWRGGSGTRQLWVSTLALGK